MSLLHKTFNAKQAKIVPTDGILLPQFSAAVLSAFSITNPKLQVLSTLNNDIFQRTIYSVEVLENSAPIHKYLTIYVLLFRSISVYSSAGYNAVKLVEVFLLQYIEGAIKLHQDCNATCIYQTILELSECSGILPLMFVHGIFTQVVSKISLKNFKFVFFREILQIQHHLKLMVFVSSCSVKM